MKYVSKVRGSHFNPLVLKQSFFLFKGPSSLKFACWAFSFQLFSIPVLIEGAHFHICGIGSLHANSKGILYGW